MHKFLKVKIFAADRIVYQGEAATIALRFFNGNLEVMCPFEDRFDLSLACDTDHGRHGIVTKMHTKIRSRTNLEEKR
jgi:hypothetical protein